MSKAVDIRSPEQLQEVIRDIKLVMVYFYTNWSDHCVQIKPRYNHLSWLFSNPPLIGFARVDFDRYPTIAAAHNASYIPTLLIFKNSEEFHRIEGGDPVHFETVVREIAGNHNYLHGGRIPGVEVDVNTFKTVPDLNQAFADLRHERKMAASVAAAASAPVEAPEPFWLGADLPKGYSDITDQVEVKGCELLNADEAKAGSVHVLFEKDRPAALAKEGKAPETAKDWVESDTDEQLLLYMPFQAMLKLHTLQITSLPSASPEDDDDEVPMRPKTIKLFTNRPRNLSFDDADELPATQQLELSASDWDPTTGTASVGLRYVKFQNITSLALFVVDGDGDGEKTRVDRIRLVGETGEKREMGKLEKIGDEPGE